MNIAVFFGGRSCEHNISVATGVQAANVLAGNGHKVYCVYVRRDGKWKSSGSFFDVEVFRGEPGGRSVYLLPGDNRLRFKWGFKKVRIDCAVLCMHGRNGEDGTIQGLLELSRIPYTGGDVFASAAGMDKQMMKKLFRADKIPSLKCVTVRKGENNENAMKKINFALGFPVIVKPSRAGSSIGIGVAHDCDELRGALESAFLWDTKVVVERAIKNFTELNCAVIGDGVQSEAGQVEKPTSFSEFLTYDEKYHGKAKSGSGREFPANIDEATAERVRSLAVRAFDSVGASGIARVDFLLDNDTGKLYVNEINTIPGSLALYLFPEKSKRETLFLLIDIAIKRQKENDRLSYVYDDKLLKKG